MILKTSTGSQGVGVMYVESDKALHGIVQLLYREDKYVDILLQELIKTDYDVRVIVVGDQILGAMKRPIIKGDFRSNVSQGSEPEVHELTELEKTESLIQKQLMVTLWVLILFQQKTKKKRNHILLR